MRRTAFALVFNMPIPDKQASRRAALGTPFLRERRTFLSAAPGYASRMRFAGGGCVTAVALALAKPFHVGRVGQIVRP